MLNNDLTELQKKILTQIPLKDFTTREILNKNIKMTSISSVLSSLLVKNILELRPARNNSLGRFVKQFRLTKKGLKIRKLVLSEK